MTNIFDEFRRFEESMNKMFEEIWNIQRKSPLLLPSGEMSIDRMGQYRSPFIDIVETDKEVIATADMPGLEKGDIKINLTEDRIEISAETKREEEKKEKGYIYRERHGGSYYRSVSLPSQIDPDGAKATYNNGVLHVTMTKVDIKKKSPVKID